MKATVLGTQLIDYVSKKSNKPVKGYPLCFSNVFRITDYSCPFDSCRGQDVVVIEEFRPGFSFSDMLNYLDGYLLFVRRIKMIMHFTEAGIRTQKVEMLPDGFYRLVPGGRCLFMTLKKLLSELNFEGHISLRRNNFGGMQYIGGGSPEKISARYGGYKVDKTVIIGNILVVFVK